MNKSRSTEDAGLSLLISGAIRDIPAFEASLHAASAVAKVTGLNKVFVVISTWDSDLPNAMKISSDFECDICEFLVVNSRNIACDFAGNWIRQSILLSNGLKAIPRGSYVLKMRTDKTEWVAGFANKIFQLNEQSDPQSGLFSGRIIIPTAMALEPYFYNDMVYAGKASDLLKLVPRLIQPLVEQWIINPEQIFHIAPVLGENEDIPRFFRQNRGLPHGHQPEELQLRNARILRDRLHLNVAIQSLEHLLQCYAFPADYSASPSSLDELTAYLGNANERLVEILSTPPPQSLNQHLSFNDSAKSLVVSSSYAVHMLLESLRVCMSG